MKASRRPFVTANFAITADGKVSTRNATPANFTSPRDKARLHEIRASADAIIAGRNTVAVDTMSMRLSVQSLQERRSSQGQPPEPLRVVASNTGTLDPKWKIFAPAPRPPVIFASQAMTAKKRTVLAPLCDLHILPGESVNLRTALAILHDDYGVRRLLCEGGPGLFRSLLKLGVVDELNLTVAPCIFGGKDAPSLTGLPGPFLNPLCRFKLAHMETAGSECFLTWRRTED